ncbi:hypothetical protein NZK35_17850 [Stieleria sp. ICT_E10.1]|uniref:hypothetical protein n=1 Tax=Stieleria sedimenti TaxID=2976331 RepID=UPI0021808161|nr:hypothetical protein [Stieleria sedimenti]MCS7468520.1 hypothetical protein [Stieleria sedimenti]
MNTSLQPTLTFRLLIGIVLSHIFLACINVNAAEVVTVDMEGLAPEGGFTTDDDINQTFGIFSLIVPHGHFFDSAYAGGGGRPSNGTDWYMNDWPEEKPGFSIERTDGGQFTAISFDATEWSSGFDTQTQITVTGQLADGGTVVQQFTTDSVAATFETFTLDPSFTGLSRLDFLDEGHFAGHFEGVLGYDNIVLTAVPEPTMCPILGLMAVLTVGRRSIRRRSRATVLRHVDA